MSNEICEVPIISTVCDGVDAIFGDGFAELVTMPFTWLAAASANTAAWLFEGVWGIFHTTTLVDLTDPQYLQVYNVVFGFALLITFAFFCLQLIGSLIRREPGALARAATGMAKSVVGSFVLVTITVILLEISRPALHGHHPGHRHDLGGDGRQDRRPRRRPGGAEHGRTGRGGVGDDLLVLPRDLRGDHRRGSACSCARPSSSCCVVIGPIASAGPGGCHQGGGSRSG